jgi:hypothetical protein
VGGYVVYETGAIGGRAREKAGHVSDIAAAELAVHELPLTDCGLMNRLPLVMDICDLAMNEMPAIAKFTLASTLPRPKLAVRLADWKVPVLNTVEPFTSAVGVVAPITEYVAMVLFACRAVRSVNGVGRPVM